MHTWDQDTEYEGRGKLGKLRGFVDCIDRVSMQARFYLSPFFGITIYNNGNPDISYCL